MHIAPRQRADKAWGLHFDVNRKLPGLCHLVHLLQVLKKSL